MINFVVYSHSSYIDILKIQSDFIDSTLDTTLLIDKNDLSIDSIYDKFKRVIFYDSSDTYPVRLKKSLSQLDYEYILLIHDIDILLKYDLQVLESLLFFLKKNDYDRIDLKFTPIKSGDFIYEMNKNKIERIDEVKNEDSYYLISQNDTKNFIYNVNPSIWKTKTILEIMDTFPHKNYRTIEDLDVQKFSSKYKVFKIHSKKFLSCGYFECLDFFTFLHISHSGKLLPLNETFTTVYNQSYSDVKEDYINIVNNYNLKNSEKWIR